MTIGLSGKVLPIHPQPKPDEIFSSWYCRVAHTNSIKLHTFEVQLWDRSKQIWTRDIDRSIDEATLSRFAGICGTTIERANQTCLQSYNGIVFQELVRNGHANWIIPVGVYHRKRRRAGMQFCPICLATDSVPYFRKGWRLALSTFCDIHDCMLHDCCPECKAPVTYYRQELGQRWLWQVESMTLCTQCGFDLKRAAAYNPPVAEIQAWLALKHQITFLDLGWNFFGNQTVQYSHLYFDVLRNLLRKLCATLSTKRLCEAAEHELGISVKWTSPPKTAFEFLGVMERHCLLQIATWLLLEWPARFLRIAQKTDIRFSELMREFEHDVFWFRNGVNVLECKPVGPCFDERAAMRALLLDAAHDDIRLDTLKREIQKRIAKRPIRELWTEDGLAFPSKVTHGVVSNDKKGIWLGVRAALALQNFELSNTRDQRILVTATRLSLHKNTVYGLRVHGISPEHQTCFKPEWNKIEIEMDGQTHTIRLTPTFWKGKFELRSAAIRDWLQTRDLLTWSQGRPPHFELRHIQGQRFELLG